MSNAQTAYFAGGCFWCTEAVFRRLKGVEKITSGYAASNKDNPAYLEVASGNTNAAEAIKIDFNPSIIPYERLLDIFFATHDPTTLNRQGFDTGTEYRSAIFYTGQEQKEAATRSLEKAQKSGAIKGNIVTEITPFTNFFAAEEFNQDFYEKNKNLVPYCSLIIEPKIQKLLDKFNSEVKEEYKPG